MKIIFLIFFLGILAIPFYLFKSGMPQISHLLLFIIFIIFVIRDGKYLNINRIFNGYRFLLSFILWSFIIGIIYFSIFKDLKTIIAPTYFLFNFMAMYSLIRLYFINKTYLLKLIFNALFFGIILLFMVDILNLEGFFHGGDIFYRKTLTFNNPNQLGYWALSTATILFIIKPSLQKSPTNTFKFYSSIIILIYLSLISLSKAATISIIVLIFLNSLKNFRLVILSSAIMFFTYNTLINLENDNFLIRFDKRMNNVGDASDDNLEGRGYLRITNNPEYIFFGAGEGATEERFGTPMELHSSFGTILFSYGIVGLILFLIFLYQIFKISRIGFFQLLIPLLLYGITHMGLRFTLFWLSLALFILIKKSIQNKKVLLNKFTTK